jgi:hypothetical protein
MAGKAMSQYADFVLLSNNYALKHQTESGIINELQATRYLTATLARNQPASKIIKTGKAITSYTQFTAGTQAAFYQPGDSFTTSFEDTSTQLSFQFRFLHDSWAYLRQEIVLNGAGDDQFSIDSRIVELTKAKRQHQRVGMYNTVEAAWWTAASAATMETAATANRPYSIRAFITEDGQHPSGFTTLAGIASTQTRYRNKVSNYTAGAIDTTLQPAFGNMWTKLSFESPPDMNKYFTETRWSKFNILTDINGRETYRSQTQNSNDRLIGSGKDLGVYAGDLPYAGVPVKYIPEMDGIGYASTQPRYFWVNSDYLFPVYNTAAYFAEMEPMNSVNQPHAYTVHVDLWYQLVCTSRARQGIVCPG